MIYKIREILILFLLSLGHSLKTEAGTDLLKVVQSYENKKAYESLIKYLHRNRFYFSSIHYSKILIQGSSKHLKSLDPLLTKIILKSGPQTYFNISDEKLASHQTPSLNFVLTLKTFKKRAFQKAIVFSQLIPQNHRFFPETSMVTGSAYYFLGKHKLAKSKFKICYNSSKSLENDSGHKKLKRYYAIIKENCLINLARISYKTNQFSKALKSYEHIQKNSYLWPYILREKAWASFQNGDYNRALGVSMAYKSPLLSSYFLPEVEVLKAMSYFKLCQYEDALLLIDQYYNVFKPNSEKLRLLLTNNKTKNFFYKLMTKKSVDGAPSNVFITNLKTQTKKRIKYSLDWLTIKKIFYEIKLIKTLPKSKIRTQLFNRLVRIFNEKVKGLNFFVKKEFYSYINKIHRFSYELFKIRLEIYSRKRDLIYNHKKMAKKRERGNQRNLVRNKNQFLWDFRVEFWADELGDYSFGLQSICKKTGKEIDV